MYCPRCSQQQVTDDASFCSRCGFQLGVVKELLVTDGALPARATDFKSGFSSPGRRGARLGAKLIFFSLISLPLFIALSVNADSPIPFWPPGLIFLAGLTFVLYARIFREDILPSKKQAQLDTFRHDRKYAQTTFAVRGVQDRIRRRARKHGRDNSATEHYRAYLL